MAIVRPEQSGDEPAIGAIHVAAFPDATEAELVARLRGTEWWVPELSLVVQQDDALVAHALFSRLPLADEERPMLTLGPIAVLPDYQRKGVGLTLARMGLSRARQLGYTAVIAVGIPEFMAACGFRPARPRGLETKMAVPDESFVVAELREGGIVKGSVAWPAEWELDQEQLPADVDH
jgi:putative acetyltransferase